MKLVKFFWMLFFVFILLALILIIYPSEDKGEIDESYFYDELMDNNQRILDQSKDIFITQQVVDLQSYEIDELNLEISNLEYFQEKYDELNIGENKLSPGDKISADNINVEYNKIILNLDNTAQVGYITDTGSMDPVLDVGSHAIQIMPSSEDDIDLGDIITYRPSYDFDKQIIHRVVEISKDDNGWYVIAKGDNNPVLDPDRIRFEQITGVLVAIIY